MYLCPDRPNSILSVWSLPRQQPGGRKHRFDTPHGRMMATMLAGIAQFERDLISERVKSGLAAAKAWGKKLGRRPGQRPKSDRLAPKVLQAISEGRSYRWIARDLGIRDTNTFRVKMHVNALVSKTAMHLRHQQYGTDRVFTQRF